MIDFRILTFVTDHEMYAQMRRSFEDAGFVEPIARYQIVDNSVRNAADPYQLVNSVLDEMTEAYLIVCHQDIRLEEPATLTSLDRQLEQAGQMYPNWGVVGVAGLGMDYKQVLCVTDPWNVPKWPGPWPVEAEVLDELFLLIRPGRAELSTGLSGFHFYAADLCMSARRLGGSALIINFPILHLSNGEKGRLSPAYRAARAAIQTRLSPLYTFRILRTSTMETMVLSRFRMVRRYADRGKIHRAAIWAMGRRVVP
jgi:hypothetical protein